VRGEVIAEEWQQRGGIDLALAGVQSADPLHHVLELPHVAEPGMREQNRLGIGGEPRSLDSPIEGEEMPGERNDVAGTLAKRRQADLDLVQTEQQVAAERP